MEETISELRKGIFERRSDATMGITKRKRFASDTHLECSKCRQILPKDRFWKDGKSIHGVQGFCIKCKTSTYRTWRHDWNGKIVSLLHHAREAHVKRSLNRDIGTLNVTRDMIIDMLETQKFACYYSGQKLTPENVSLERLNPYITYTPGNMALIRHHFQCTRQWTTEKFQSVPTLRSLDTYDDVMVSKAFLWQDWSEQNMANKAVYSKAPNETEWMYHENNKAAAEFRGAKTCNVSNVCNPTSQLKSTAGCVFRYATPKIAQPLDAPPPLVPFCQRLLGGAKSHTKQRNIRRGKADRPLLCEPTITTRDILELYRTQRGRCAYLDIPLLIDHGDDNSWTCSLERVDRDVGYTAENCVLVVEEVNDAAQWSRADAELYWPV